MPERVVALAKTVSTIADEKVKAIQQINSQARLLALNAQIEAAHAGSAGAAFGIVAKEVKSIATAIQLLTVELTGQLQPRLRELDSLGQGLVATVRGTRLAELALNMIEIIDRNLYERSCDVRWWATDSAVVAACSDPSPLVLANASKRLGIIIDNYTVYCELVVCSTKGGTLAHARPSKFPRLGAASMAEWTWFRRAMKTRDGTEFVVGDIEPMPELNGRRVATYGAAIREGGETAGKVIGVLGVMFDWETQSQAVVDNVRLSPGERDTTRALIVDKDYRILAASDRQGILRDVLSLKTGGKDIGHFQPDDGSVIGFALTPGYETYKGLGWYGVLVQKRPSTK